MEDDVKDAEEVLPCSSLSSLSSLLRFFECDEVNDFEVDIFWLLDFFLVDAYSSSSSSKSGQSDAVCFP